MMLFFEIRPFCAASEARRSRFGKFSWAPPSGHVMFAFKERRSSRLSEVLKHLEFAKTLSRFKLLVLYSINLVFGNLESAKLALEKSGF